MKSKLCLLLLIAISLIILVGCGSNNNRTPAEITEWEPSIYGTVNNVDGVTMTVKVGTVSSTGMTLILENKSNNQYIYGNPYLLEKKINGSWYQVPIALDGDYGFDDIGYELASSDVSEWTVDWEWHYGKLVTGEYRIVKDLLDVRKPGDYDTHHLTAEFTIN